MAVKEKTVLRAVNEIVYGHDAKTREKKVIEPGTIIDEAVAKEAKLSDEDLASFQERGIVEEATVLVEVQKTEAK